MGRVHSYRLIVKQNGKVISDVTTTCTCDIGQDHQDTLGS